ncbi:hypothetical protein ACIQVU_00705 [Lysinibacillus sp. NPDC098008]|uniref:hypothetical protein n=1 Tax=Lysinibacillus sp. NPDC098008 TaxID=3364146 RepID=UPI003827F20A
MTYDFWIMASVTELIDYPDDGSDDYTPQSTFQALMDILAIHVPIEEIVHRFFQQSIHTGDVLVFINQHQPDTCIVLDTYRHPLDQQDTIQFGWRVNTKLDLYRIRQLTRQLYDNCEFAVRYEEGLSVLYKVLQQERYPYKYYYQTVYEQQLKQYTTKKGFVTRL